VGNALAAIGRCQSVTLDPHKLGYVPYSSGTFLTADRRDYTCVRTLAPYLDSHQPDHGPYTLEGSRSAAGAVATWLTSRSIGLDRGGYGLLLARTVRQKQKVEECLLRRLGSARIYPGCDTNLLCFCIADAGEAVSASNGRCLRILDRLCAERLYYLSKTQFPLDGPAGKFVSTWSARVDVGHLVVLRMCLMNPFFDSGELDVDHVEHLVFSISEFAD
jgi:glutamate/tyrosine decarboxylase-like PLP-dependent enzyme